MERGRCTAIQKVNTVVNADSVEWCPYSNCQHILLCGTYKLQESAVSKDDSSLPSTDLSDASQPAVEDAQLQTSTSAEPQIRLGGVLVYTLSFEDGSPLLQPSANVDMYGVLDMKWPNEQLGNNTVFGLVDAEGCFQLIELKNGGNDLKPVSKKKLSDSSLGLSLGWSCVTDGTGHVVVSDSKGHLTVFDVGDSVSRVLSWPAHDYEAWITAYHNSNRNLLFSGGDDCRLKFWDTRDITKPVFTSRRHQMGVCSIQSHPFLDNIFATGSYDEELNIWDHRQLKQPLTSSSLGGGIWRIKWDPFQGTKILTATMYNGTHVVDCSDLGQNSLPVIAQYTDHNLAYGADWCRLPARESSRHNECNYTMGEKNAAGESQRPESFLISTCSFYDHSLHLWELKD